MSDNSITELSREEIRSQLSNWLRLMELAGTRDVIWKPGYGSRSDLGPDVSKPAAEGRTLDGLRERMAGCTCCELHKTRTNVVFGEGSPRSELIFIGEGPGRDEDLSGRPFVGRAGALLTRIIEAMGLARSDVYIANIVKCRPPGNRNPEPDEVMECLPFLEEQVDLIGPKVICSLGNVATQTLTGVRDGITRMRVKSYEYRGILVIPTFHPAACLRNPGIKKDVWEDIKKVMKALGLTTRGVKRDGAGKNKR
jgi:uracil-DNA glycosylase family 4